MKKKLLQLTTSLLVLINCQKAVSQQSIPHLAKKGTTTQLIVDDKPFIILGGELGNSTATTIQNMQPVWAKLKIMNLNTVLVPVYWELLEPQEGAFDFTLLQDLIIEARKNDMKIVYLWFGSWSECGSIAACDGCLESRRKRY